MMKHLQFFIIVALGFILMAAGFPNLPQQLLNYVGINLPSTLTTNRVNALDNTPINNSLTDEGATLGRVLFYLSLIHI